MICISKLRAFSAVEKTGELNELITWFLRNWGSFPQFIEQKNLSFSRSDFFI